MTLKVNNTTISITDFQGDKSKYFDIELQRLFPGSSDNVLKRLVSCEDEKQYLQYKAQQSIPYDLSTTNYISVTQQPEDNTELFTNVSNFNRCLPFNLSFNISSDAISEGTKYLLEQPNLLQCKSQDNTLYFKIPAWENAWKKVDSNVLSNNNSVSLEASNDGTALVKNYYAYTNSDTYYIDTEIPAEEPTFILQNASIVGNLNNTNEVYSNFSQNNYILLNITSPTTSLEFVVAFTPDSTSPGDILRTQPDGTGILLRNSTCYLSSTGSGWNVLSGFSTGLTYTAGVLNYIKITWDSTNGIYTFWQSLDGVNWTEKNSSDSGKAAVYWNNTQTLGACSSYSEHFYGSIDLIKTNVVIDGVKINFERFIPKSTIYQKIDNDFNKLTPQPAFIAKVPGLLNATVVGNLIDNNGVYSGFGTSNYLQSTFIPDLTKPFTFIIKFKQNSTRSYNWLFATTGSEYKGFACFINSSNKLFLSTGNSAGNGWQIDQAGVSTLSTNQDYWLKYTFDGASTHNVYLSTTGEFNGEETTEFTKTNGSGIYSTSSLLLGHSYSWSGNQYLDGTIDMKNTSITIDGVTTTFYNTVTSITFNNTEYTRDSAKDGSEDIYVANQLQLKVNNATYTLVDNMDDMPIITTGTLVIREDLK